MKRNSRLVTPLVLAGVVVACVWSASATNPVRFGVIADPHLHDVRLGTSGHAWQMMLYQDPKLLKESEAILESAFKSIVQQNVNFLLIPGDLTKDGEILNHVRMTQHLAELEQQGVKVYVVPGNHDINNPYAVAYVGDGTRPVPTVTPKMFRALYQRFGYGEALARDTNSLSYVAEPVPGLWVLAIDSCKYADNALLGTPVVSGQISPETMNWISAQLHQAQVAGKKVVGLMHHGVNLHFLGQDQLFEDYLVDNWPLTSAGLARAGLGVVFTGHYHAQDAAIREVDDPGRPTAAICDVQTGSLAQYPCAFRIVTVDGGKLHIQSQRVTEADVDTAGPRLRKLGNRPVSAPSNPSKLLKTPWHSPAVHPMAPSFQEFAEQNLRGLMQVQIHEVLSTGFGLNEPQIAVVAPLVTDALVANYAGDEMPSAATANLIEQMISQGGPMEQLGALLLGIWTDLDPADNVLTVSLSPGGTVDPPPINDDDDWGPPVSR